MHFITDPYLPNGQVKMIIAGDGLREYENAMQSLGISVLYTKKADCISGALATHADLVVFPYGNGRFLLDPGQEQLANTLREKARNVHSEVCRRTVILWTRLITLSKSEKR